MTYKLGSLFDGSGGFPLAGFLYVMQGITEAMKGGDLPENRTNRR